MGKRNRGRKRRGNRSNGTTTASRQIITPPIRGRTPPIHFDFMKGYHPWVRGMIEDMDRWGIEKAGELATSWFGFSPSLVHQAECLLHYRYYAQKVYQIPSRFQKAMSRPIGAGKINPDDIVLPYPCFYLLLPDCEWKLWGGERTGWHQIGGFYALEDSKEQCINFHFWGMPNEKSEGGDDASFWFRLNLDDLFNVRSKGNLQKYLKDLFADNTQRIDEHPVPDNKINKQVLQGITEAVYLFFNIILYMQCRNADVVRLPNRSEDQRTQLEREKGSLKNPNKGSSKKKARQIQKKLHMLSEASVVLVGGVEARKMEERDRNAATKRANGEKPDRAKTPAIMPQHYNYYWCGSKTDANDQPTGRCYKKHCDCPSQHKEARLIEGYVRNGGDDKPKSATRKRGTRYRFVGEPLTRDEMHEHLGREDQA